MGGGLSAGTGFGSGGQALFLVDDRGMNEDGVADRPREVRREAGVLSSFCNVLFSDGGEEALFHLIVGLFRGVGMVLGWMLELLP